MVLKFFAKVWKQLIRLHRTISFFGSGAAKVANLLVDRGININATDDVNATALHIVAENGTSSRLEKSVRNQNHVRFHFG